MNREPGVVARDSISFEELLRIWWKHRVALLATTMAAVVCATLLAFFMEKVYRAQVTVIPVEANTAQSALSGLAGQLGGLAALTGALDLTSGRKAEAVGLLRSQSVIQGFIQERQLLPVLFADEWDSDAAQWDVPPDDVPTLQDGYKLFDEEIRRVSEDLARGVVTLEINWRDNEQAADWANAIVDRVNDTMRRRTIEEANSSLGFLNSELEKASVLELRQVLYNVMQEMITNAALANAQEQYGLRIIDPAVAPSIDDFVRPRRGLIILSGLVGGLLFASIIAVFRETVRL